MIWNTRTPSELHKRSLFLLDLGFFCGNNCTIDGGVHLKNKMKIKRYFLEEIFNVVSACNELLT